MRVNTMEKLLSQFLLDTEELYKSYRLQHFSLKLMWSTYYDYKNENPQITNFKIFDKDLDETISFTEGNIEESAEYGKYQEILSATTVVMFYQLWDDYYRVAIAKRYSCSKNEINSDLFAELNKVRRAIIHNQFNPKECAGKLDILNFLISENKNFLLSSLEVRQIYNLIKKEIGRLKLELSIAN